MNSCAESRCCRYKSNGSERSRTTSLAMSRRIVLPEFLIPIRRKVDGITMCWARYAIIAALCGSIMIF